MVKDVDWSSSDGRGNSRSVRFVVDDGEIVERLEKNGRVTHDIRFNRSQFRQLFSEALGMQNDLVEEGGSTDHLEKGIEGASVEARLKLMDAIASTFSTEEVVRIMDEDTDGFDNVKKAGRAVDVDPSTANREKTKEMVLQLIYDNYGDDWFTTTQFKEIYNNNFDRSKYNNWLNQLDRQSFLQSEPIDYEDRDDPWDKKRYRIAPSRLDKISKYGSFTKGNPVFEKKMSMLHPDVRKQFV